MHSHNMSGHRVVALLEERGDVFLHGGPLRRRKGTAVARARLLLSTTTASSAQAAEGGGGTVEFVVGTKRTYKIRSKKVAGGGLPGDGEHGDGGGAAAMATVIDFDADAMMQAAQRGEDIPTAIRKAEAAARAKQRLATQQHSQQQGSLQAEEEEALATVDALVSSPRGEAELTALKVRRARNEMDVLWAQEHCYVKCVTPLTTIEAEHELQRERDEEEKREREELFHLMHDDEEFNNIKKPAAASSTSTAAKTTITGGVPVTISPNDPRIDEHMVNGFVVHFFDMGKPEPKPYGHQIGRAHV